MVQDYGTLIRDAEDIVSSAMKTYDPSHDTLHVDRVRKLAVRIAKSIPEADLLVVELAALFHDLFDYKYFDGNDTAGKSRKESLDRCMARHGLTEHQRSTVLHIVEDTGTSKEKKLRAAGQWTSWHDTCVEFHCVHDADRLDAIGAVGIFRVSAYSGVKYRPLYFSEEFADPANQLSIHQVKDGSAYSHYFEKLLLLKDTMRTELGQKLACSRHNLMKAYIEQLELEIRGDDDVCRESLVR